MLKIITGQINQSTYVPDEVFSKTQAVPQKTAEKTSEINHQELQNRFEKLIAGRRCSYAYNTCDSVESCDSVTCDGVTCDSVGVCDAVCDAVICDSNVCDTVCDQVCDTICDQVCDGICDTVCDTVCDSVCDCVKV